jgi:hypothetical protein
VVLGLTDLGRLPLVSWVNARNLYLAGIVILGRAILGIVKINLSLRRMMCPHQGPQGYVMYLCGTADVASGRCGFLLYGWSTKVFTCHIMLWGIPLHWIVSLFLARRDGASSLCPIAEGCSEVCIQLCMTGYVIPCVMYLTKFLLVQARLRIVTYRTCFAKFRKGSTSCPTNIPAKMGTSGRLSTPGNEEDLIRRNIYIADME